MKKISIIFLMFMIVTSINIIAAPPFIAEQSSGSAGLFIKTPQQPYYLANTNGIDFHFHVFNETGYPLTNITVNCLLHIYNSTGNHVLKSIASYDEPDFEVEINSTISNNPDYYSYIFQCNTTNKGGFIGETFEISTTQNKESSVSGSILAIMILLPMLFGIMLLLGSFLLDPIEHNVLRIFLLFFSFITYFISSWFGVMSLIRYYNFVELTNSTITSVWIAGVMLFVILSYFMIYIFFQISQKAAQNKKEMMLQ